MDRDRLVFETAKGRKEALSRALRDEGLSLSEWFQERLELLLPNSIRLPVYQEIASPDELRDASAVMKALRAVDWSFTDDDTLYLTHDLHPYPAKFIPQIPGHLIGQLSLRGEVVLDPFGGSGTTAFEAIRLGRRAISLDANPVGTLIGRVKTARVDSEVMTDLRALRRTLRTKIQLLPAASDALFEELHDFVPEIPNLEKWFPRTSCGELALIRACISGLSSSGARDIALLALSRVVLRVSFQDSETRYASKQRTIPPTMTVQRFLHDLDLITKKVVGSSSELQYGVARFVTADSRSLSHEEFPDNCVDLIVTSPPYGNSNDYHLYHRFRLFWIGSDPRDLAKVEIGSHLRHQKENTGFKSYLDDMKPCLEQMYRLLKSGRYAALVVGDTIYKGKQHDSCRALAEISKPCGFEEVGVLERPVHATKRSFVAPGRRANTEKILILRKPPQELFIELTPPRYRMWPYEELMRERETKALLGRKGQNGAARWRMKVDPYALRKARRLVFTQTMSCGPYREPTWQGILENGPAARASRKDPKYVTHGLHPYKGKFYPQLAKGLLNLVGVADGSRVLDPFCGSGTTLLECKLNGLQAFGADLHPLAAKIASAKVGILDIAPNSITESVNVLAKNVAAIPADFPRRVEQFPENSLDEISRWFPEPVVYKLNWLLGQIRSSSTGVVTEFLEIILSSIIREISHQDPSDLRIRRRKRPLEDSDVLGLFQGRLIAQMERLQRFWSIRGFCPYRMHPAQVIMDDSRDAKTFEKMGIEPESVDLVLTSPPYATALPYIDTDRLSLLVLFGMSSKERRPLEEDLTGSREIQTRARRALECEIESRTTGLPVPILDYVQALHNASRRHSPGFRRRNLPSLLLRFFGDIRKVFLNCRDVLHSKGEALIVIGDNYTMVNRVRKRIPTTEFLVELAEEVGLRLVESIPITVTTENLKHTKHAITRNTVLRLAVKRRERGG